MGTILVTGAAGFIGWKTAVRLLDHGHEVVGIDNMNDYYDVRLKNHRLEDLEKRKKFKFYRIDIEDAYALDDLFTTREFEAVVNLAARAGVRYSMENPHVYMSTNAQGTLNLLEAMRKYGCAKMVLASTSSLFLSIPILTRPSTACMASSCMFGCWPLKVISVSIELFPGGVVLAAKFIGKLHLLNTYWGSGK